MSKSLHFAMGIGLGLLFGVGMLVGAVVGLRATSQPTFEPPLHATATHGGDNFAIATGEISDGVEGIFFLDFLTGELQCYVVHPRTGALGGAFKHNVIADLGVDREKKPTYLMVTGRANFRTTGGSVRPADSIVYVVDANTGNFAAYSLPWNRQASAVGAAQMSPMLLVGKGRTRNLEIRE